MSRKLKISGGAPRKRRAGMPGLLVRSVLYAATLSMITTLLVGVAAQSHTVRGVHPLGRVRLASSTSGLVVKVGYANTSNGGLTPSPWSGSSVTYFNCADGNGGSCSSRAYASRDAGAILLYNPTSSTITVDGVTLVMVMPDNRLLDDGDTNSSDGYVFGTFNLDPEYKYQGNVWGVSSSSTIPLSPGDYAILTGINTSDLVYGTVCAGTNLSASATVAITVGTKTSYYADPTALVADQGLDSGYCGRSESSPWTQVQHTSYPIGGPVPRSALYGRCNALMSCSAGTMPVHHSTKHPIDTASGDLSVSVPGFSVPALAHSLDFGLSYDAMQVQQQISAGTDVDNDGDAGLDTDGDGDGNYAGPFGWGWSMTNAPVLAVSGSSPASSVISIQGDGAQTDFIAPGSSGCPSPYVAPQGSPAGAYCALPRVTGGTLSYSSGAYILSEKGGMSTFGFDQSGHLSYESTATQPGQQLTVTDDVSPSTGGCPSSTTYTWLSFCTVYTSPAAAAIPPGATIPLGTTMAIGYDKNGISQGVFDPAGNEWTFGYDSNANLTSVTNPKNETTTFTYDTANTVPSLIHDLCSKTEPGFTAPTSCPTAGDNTSPSCPTGTSCYTYATHYPLANGSSSMTSAWSPGTSIDSGNSLKSVSCTTRDFCVAVDAVGNALSYDGAFWSPPTSIDGANPLNSVTCPSASFCVAVDSKGNALTWNGAAWSSPTSIDSNPLNSVSCAGTSFCVAVDSKGNEVTWNGSSWSSPTSIDSNPLNSVSCAGTSFCVAVDSAGNDVAYNGTSWSTSPTSIDSGNSLNSVSCASSSFCVAVDSAGNEVTWNGSSWSSPTSIDGANSLSSVSCTDYTFCAAVDSKGNALTFNGTTPTSAPIDSGSSLNSISCPEPTYCAAVDASGNVFSYNSTARVVEYVNPIGQKTTYTYAGNRNTAEGSWTSITEPNGDVSKYAYVYGELVARTTYGSNALAGLQQNTNPATTLYVRDAGTLLATSRIGPDANTTSYTYDPFGNLVSKTNALGGVTSYSYNSFDEVTSSTDPMGRVTTSTYDSNGNLCWSAPYAVSSPSCGFPPANQASPPAGPTVYAYNSVGEMQTMTGPTGDVVTYAYYPNGQLCWSAPYAVSSPSCGSPPADQTSPPAGPTIYTYDPMGNVTSVEDPMGNYTTSAYDAIGQLCWSAPFYVSSPSCLSPPADQTSPPAGPTIYAYDSMGNVVSVEDPMLNYTTSAYNAIGEKCWSVPAEVTSPSCSSPPASATVYTYDALGNRTQVKNPTAGVPASETASLTSVSCVAGSSFCMAVDSGGNYLVYYSSAWAGPYPMDSGHSLNSISCTTSGSSFCAAVDSGGNAFVNNGSTWSSAISIDGTNSLTSVSCPSSSFCAAVDSGGNALTYNGSTSTWSSATSIDSGYSLNSVSCPTASFCVAVDSGGNALSYNGSSWSKTLIDAYGLNTVSCASSTYCVVLDSLQNAIVLNGANWASSATTYAYNDAASPSAVTAQATGSNATSYTYDPSGNLMTKTTPADVISYAYDALHRLCWKDAGSTQVSGTCSSPPAGAVTFSYNADSQVTQMVDATGTTSYSYDSLGRLLATTDSNYQLVSYGYDAASEVICIGYPLGPGLGSGNCSNSASSSNPIATRSYDSVGRLASVTDWLGNTTTFLGNTTTFSYNADSLVTGIQYPSSTATPTSSDTSTSVSFGYDSESRLTSEVVTNTSSSADEDADGDSATSDSDSTNDSATGTSDSNYYIGYYTYNADNLRTSYSGQPNSSGPTYSYSANARNYLTGYYSSTYDYDADADGDSSTSSPLDANDSGPGASDANVGLPTYSSVPGSTTTTATSYVYNPAQQLCWSVSPAFTLTSTTSTPGCSAPPSGAMTYSYDASGQLSSVTGTPPGGTTAQTASFSYGPYGDLNCFTAPNSSGYSCANQSFSYTSTYTYNADHLRMTALPAQSATTQLFAWDTNTSSTPRIISDSTNYYIYGPSIFGGAPEPIEQLPIGSQTPSYLVFSPRSLRMIISSTGAVQNYYHCSPWGNCAFSVPSGATSPFGFAGGYSDSSTAPFGLVYLVNRYYAAFIRQFISVDPAVSATGTPYAYAGNDPVNGNDPNGLSWYDPSWVHKAFHFVAKHWRGIAQVAIATTAVVVSVASLGTLSGASLVLASAAIGAFSAQAGYYAGCAGTSSGCTITGALTSTVAGGISGGAGAGLGGTLCKSSVCLAALGVLVSTAVGTGAYFGDSYLEGSCVTAGGASGAAANGFGGLSMTNRDWKRLLSALERAISSGSAGDE